MTINSKTSSVYFENLNAIRFIAASLVVFHHIEQFKAIFGLPNFWNNEVVFIIGKLGVILFFVLSGFLISYLLYKEKELTNTIGIKNFYVRRILRIWPLYFLIILLALFLFPHIDFFSIPGVTKEMVFQNLTFKLLLYVFFLPNLVLNIYGTIPFASPTWSIGAEEQFYLIWPVLNKYFKNKYVLIFSVILIYRLIKRYMLYLPNSDFTIIFKGFWQSTPIQCMAIGGFFALIVYDTKSKFSNKLKHILYSKLLQWSVLILTVFFIFNAFQIYFFHYEFYSILFGILIMNFAANPKRIFSMENKILNYLGKISYGLYMFHSIVIVVVIKICQHFNWSSNFIIYPLTFILLILVSSISYTFFEQYFINKKIKFTTVLSGDSVKIKL